MSNNYTLDININNIDNAEGSNIAGGAETGGNVGSGGGKKNTGGMANLYKSVTAGVSAIAPISQVINYELSRVGVENGNSRQQAKIDAGMNLGKQAIGIIGAFAIGGPIVGAGALLVAGISYATKQSTFAYEARWESIAVQQAQARQGISINDSRERRV